MGGSVPKAGCTLPALLLFCLFFCTPSRRSDLVLSRLASASPAVRTTPSYGVNLVGIDTPEEHSTTATSDSISVMFRPRKRFSQLRRTPRADPDVAEELLPSGTLRGAGSAPARTKAEGAGSRTRKVVLRLTTVSSLHRNPDGSVVCGEGGTYVPVTAGGGGGSPVSRGPSGHLIHVEGASLAPVGGKATVPLVNSEGAAVQPGASLVLLCTGVGAYAVAAPAPKALKTTVQARKGRHDSRGYAAALGRHYVKRMDNLASRARAVARIASVVGYSVLGVCVARHMYMAKAVQDMERHGRLQPLLAALVDRGVVPRVREDLQIFFLLNSVGNANNVRFMRKELGEDDPRFLLYKRLHLSAARTRKYHVIAAVVLSGVSALRSFAKDRLRAAQAEAKWLARRKRGTGDRGRGGEEDEADDTADGSLPAPEIEVELTEDSL